VTIEREFAMEISGWIGVWIGGRIGVEIENAMEIGGRIGVAVELRFLGKQAERLRRRD
jgi:hypothetical protein